MLTMTSASATIWAQGHYGQESYTALGVLVRPGDEEQLIQELRKVRDAERAAEQDSATHRIQ